MTVPYQCSVAAVASALAQASGRVKMVVVTSPNNPTGVVIDTNRLAALASLCANHGAWFVLDEAYADIEHVDAEAGGCSDIIDARSVNTPVASPTETEGGVIRLFTFSKGMSMAGWRLGYALFPDCLARNYSTGHPTQLHTIRIAAGVQL